VGRGAGWSLAGDLLMAVLVGTVAASTRCGFIPDMTAGGRGGGGGWADRDGDAWQRLCLLLSWLQSRLHWWKCSSCRLCWLLLLLLESLCGRGPARTASEAAY